VVNKPEKNEKQPAHKIRMGKVVATIWLNEGEGKDGKAYKNYTVNIVQSYTDKDGNWKDSSSFRMNDLMGVHVCAYEAYKWIREHPIEKGDD